MNILFTTGGDYKYGESNSLLQLVEELKHINSSIEVSVIINRKMDRVNDFKRIGCNVYIIPYFPFYQGIPPKKWRLPVKYVIRGIQYLYSRMFAASKLTKKIDMDTIDLIHSNSSREDLGAILAKKYAIPLVWHIREFGDLDFPCYSYRKNYIRFMNESATKFIGISQAVMKHWINKGLASEKFIQIYNGVKVNGNIKTKYPKQGDIVKFVIMGSLSETKGQHHVIKAIALLINEIRQRIQVDIVGDGSTRYTNYIKHLIKTNRLSEQIHLLGYKKMFYTHLKEYDCGFMCSRCEGFGRVTAEYMMAGLPVIASDTGANPEIVENNINGLLYGYGDDYELAEKITYLINNTYKIEELGKKAYIIASEKYSTNANATSLLQEYNKVLNEL